MTNAMCLCLGALVGVHFTGTIILVVELICTYIDGRKKARSKKESDVK